MHKAILKRLNKKLNKLKKISPKRYKKLETKLRRLSK